MERGAVVLGDRCGSSRWVEAIAQGKQAGVPLRSLWSTSPPPWEGGYLVPRGVAEVASLVGVPGERFLSAQELAALKGQLNPHGVIVPLPDA